MSIEELKSYLLGYSEATAELINQIIEYLPDDDIEDDFEGVLSRLRLEGVKTYAAVVSKQAGEIRSVKFPLNSAIVIGNEGNGLKSEHSALCDEQVTIEMNGNIDSLNASVAAAILMWEMTKT